MKFDVDVVMVVFESGDYMLLGSSQHSDTQLWETIEQSAPPHYGKPLLTYFDQRSFEDAYLDTANGWRAF